MKSIHEIDLVALDPRNFPHAPLSVATSRGIRHILASTDLSAESRRAVAHAMRLAKHCQARLTLVHVFKRLEPSGPSADVGVLDQQRQNIERTELRLLKLYDVIRAQYSNTEVLFCVGDPKTEIPKLVGTLGVDLVVI
jgi:nucleotide-binding universal stress UspA family protein